MSNVVKLPWPMVGEQYKYIIMDYFESHSNMARQLSKNFNYYYLANTDGISNIMENIFLGTNMHKKYLPYLAIQQSVNGLHPHTDIDRSISVICILDGDADTVFYKRKSVHLPEPGQSYYYSQLIETERHRLEYNCWYLFNNAEIHSVENSKGNRISLTLNISSVFTDWEDACNNSVKLLG